MDVYNALLNSFVWLGLIYCIYYLYSDNAFGMGTETRYHDGTDSRTTGTYRTESKTHISVPHFGAALKYNELPFEISTVFHRPLVLQTKLNIADAHACPDPHLCLLLFITSSSTVTQWFSTTVPRHTSAPWEIVRCAVGNYHMSLYWSKKYYLVTANN